MEAATGLDVSMVAKETELMTTYTPEEEILMNSRNKDKTSYEYRPKRNEEDNGNLQ